MIETILTTFPDYIKVKDLPHDDTAYKVNHFHLFSAVFSYSVLKCGCFQFQSESFFYCHYTLFCLFYFFRLTWSRCFTRKASSSESEKSSVETVVLLCDFIPFCEHGCAPRLERGAIFVRQHHNWGKTGRRVIKEASLHSPLPRQKKNVTFFPLFILL